MVHAYDLTTVEAEASLGYTVKPWLKKSKKSK